MTVFLCPACHMKLHDKGLHDRELEQIAQREFEKQYSHELWMQEFGKDYT